ncbi:UNVERIFIED_ORG: hypothetical protein QOE_3072 [Clostridioides difficile F501]
MRSDEFACHGLLLHSTTCAFAADGTATPQRRCPVGQSGSGERGGACAHVDQLAAS